MSIWDRLRGQDSADALDRPFSRGRIRKLHAAGLIPAWALDEMLDDVEGKTPTDASWMRFVSAHLLGLGVVFVGFGVTFFFAANWSALGGWTRIGLVAAAIAASGAVAMRAGLETFAGRAALGLAGVLIGPLLAVYGQVFQTGADSFALFVLWAALLTPFVALVRWSGLFLVQVVLAETGLFLGVHQALDLDGGDVIVWVAAAAVTGAALVGVELTKRSRARWLPRVLIISTLLMLAPMSLAVTGADGLLEAAADSPLLLLLAVCGAFAFVYRRARVDVFALGAVGLVVTLLAGCELFHALDEHFRRDTWPLFFTGLFIMVGMGFVAAWIRRHLKTDDDEDDAPDRWDPAQEVAS
jgi:uncharacterized membrane protein